MSRGASRTILGALLVAVVVLAGALDFVITNPPTTNRTMTTTSTTTLTVPVTETSTITATSMATTTVTMDTNLGHVCSNASSLPILPLPNMPWFYAGVTYSGSWEAFVVVYDSGFAVFSGCYAGAGQGYFIYQNASIGRTATMLMTTYKLDGSANILQVGVNNVTSSTSIPYGSATMTSSIAGPTG